MARCYRLSLRRNFCKPTLWDAPPSELFAHAFGVFFFFNLVDLLIIDWLILCRFTPRWAILPGAEDIVNSQAVPPTLVLKACPFSPDDVPPRRRAPARKARVIAWLELEQDRCYTSAVGLLKL